MDPRVEKINQAAEFIAAKLDGRKPFAGIVLGSGDGQMMGILNDPRVTNVVEMTAAELNDWKAWRKKFFAKLVACHTC